MTFYNKKKLDELKIDFNFSEKIETNYSHAYQDMFTLMMLNGKENGFFLEIGAQHAITGGNNTYLLEKIFNWKGISIDRTQQSLESFKEHNRSAFFVFSDALQVEYEKLFKTLGYSNQFDYLSLDIEPPSQTLECLKKLPMDKYRFSVITYETDYYNKNMGEAEAERVRTESRQIFDSYGYEMVVGNIGNFEDWYVDPLVVSKEIIQKMKESSEYNLEAKQYIYK
jgi:hypothetical protein